MYIEYLDLPSVPNELIDSYEEILNLPYTRKLEQSAPQYDFYKTRFIKKDLWDWLHSEIFPWFGSSFNAQYQILNSNIHRHKDRGRIVAYNYILHTGGNNVITGVYDDNKKVLQSECILPNKWHKIDVTKFHDVRNIDPKLYRISITVNPLLPEISKILGPGPHPGYYLERSNSQI